MLANQEVQASVPVNYNQQVVYYEECPAEVRKVGSSLSAVAELPQAVVLEQLGTVKQWKRRAPVEDHVHDVERQDRQHVEPEVRRADVVVVQNL